MPSLVQAPADGPVDGQDHGKPVGLVGSRIFAPFRVCSAMIDALTKTLGHVSNDVPFQIQARGQRFYVTTCVGNTFQTYDVRYYRSFAKESARHLGSYLPVKLLRSP